MEVEACKRAKLLAPGVPFKSEGRGGAPVETTGEQSNQIFNSL